MSHRNWKLIGRWLRATHWTWSYRATAYESEIPFKIGHRFSFITKKWIYLNKNVIYILNNVNIQRLKFWFNRRSQARSWRQTGTRWLICFFPIYTDYDFNYDSDSGPEINPAVFQICTFEMNHYECNWKCLKTLLWSNFYVYWCQAIVEPTILYHDENESILMQEMIALKHFK